MRRVIIESPFAGDVERNRRYLQACMRDCLLRGEAPFASHGLYTQPGVLDDNVPAERQHGISAGFVWRLVADATVIYTDLSMSKGMDFGIKDAERLRRFQVAAGQTDAESHVLEFRTLGGEWAT